MKRLILFRHGKTERHALSGDDFDRRLTVRGVEASHIMGKVLADAGLAPDFVLVSSAARAQETWTAAKPAFPDVVFDIRPELYNADRRDLMRIARKAPADAVMVVAHNPGLQDLALFLMQEAHNETLIAKIQEGFPTAAIAVFEIQDDQVTAQGLFLPREYGCGAPHD